MPVKYRIFYLLIFAWVISSCGYVNAQDTIVRDDTSKIKNDTTKKKVEKKSDFALSSKVDYKARDSIRFNIEEEKAYLYGGGEIKYEDITLTAEYIEINFKKDEVYAVGITDSTGKTKGKPVFKQGAESFTATNLNYNFKTKKGFISGIFTKEGDGYLHGRIVKKFADNSINIRNGIYTTCDLENPHFAIKFSKARVIPDNKIITGPAYLVIEGVPTPLAVPFGYFPDHKGQKSGILFPSYGESASRGFFLENGGYYFGMGQHMDLALRGDIYTHGSWALRALSNYKERYRYNGMFDLEYAINIIGEKGNTDYQRNKDFFIRWTHNQDIKAHPNSRFSANVNAGSSKYNTYNPSSTQDYLTNTFQSNISYSTTIDENYNFSLNMRHSQNTLTHVMTLDLPEIAFSRNRFYPFRSQIIAGKPKWYDNISVAYTMDAQNTINTYDSLLFKKKTLDKMQNGMKHNIPISWSGKVFKNFTWTNGINYNERWYLQSIREHYVKGILVADSLVTDTVNGFRTERDFNFTSSINTMIYGMYQFHRGNIVAIRHVITPSASFTYTPNFGSPSWGYYRYYNNGVKTVPFYSIFQTGMYGYPPSAKSGFVNLSLANNLEMKVRSKKDTTTGIKKIVLIDNFTIAGGYDLAKDSLNWSNISMSGRTKLFKKLDVTYSSLWDPYAINDSTGLDINKSELKMNKRLFRLVNTDWAFNLIWALHSKQKKKEIKSPNASDEEIQMIKNNPDKYLDFDQAWSLNLQYTVQFTGQYDQISRTILKKTIQTLSFNGDVNISDKWKVEYTSGYDFEQKNFSYTSINIYRDLHCWEMVLNWIPTGPRKSYNLTIRVKASVLQDLKLTKKKDFRDY